MVLEYVSMHISFSVARIHVVEVVNLYVVQPDTHYLLGNLLAANGNLEGSIHHYEEALYQEPLHRHAMDSLRTVKVSRRSVT